jgi:hypothetical protein
MMQSVGVSAVTPCRASLLLWMPHVVVVSHVLDLPPSVSPLDFLCLFVAAAVSHSLSIYLCFSLTFYVSRLLLALLRVLKFV